MVVGRSEGPRERTRTRVEWKNRLERALEADDLLLHLQPIIDVPTRRVVGAEALVRLDDDGVVVPPSEFVRVAERAGMATRLDHWVVRAAVAMAARLRAHGRLGAPGRTPRNPRAPADLCDDARVSCPFRSGEPPRSARN